MKIAVYPGSFDPVTLGHMNLIERAVKSFDKVIVCVMVNTEKNHLFQAEKRVELLERALANTGIDNVEVDCSAGLLSDYAAEKGVCTILKGLRAVSDFEKEFQMALINHKLNPNLDTMFLMASEQYMYLSSSVVKELAYYKADLSDFIPTEIIPDVVQAFQNRGGR